MPLSFRKARAPTGDKAPWNMPDSILSPSLRPRGRWTIVALLALGLSGCGGSPPAVPAPFTADLALAQGGVSGRVVDATTGTPIAGAVVTGAPDQQALSGPDGTFTLSGAAGLSSVSASHPGYQSQSAAAVAGQSGLTLALPEAFSPLPYAPTGTLEPGVALAGGLAIAGSSLELAGQAGSSGALSTFSLDTWSQTGRIDKLSPGTPLSPGISLPPDVSGVAGLPGGGAALLNTLGEVWIFKPDGTLGTSAQIAGGPGAIACDGQRLFVAEQGVIHLTDLSLKPLTDWQIGLFTPTGLAIDDLGNVFVATDQGAVLELDADGRLLGQWPDTGARRLSGVAVDAQGRALVTDPDGHRVVVLSSTGSPLGAFGVGELSAPRGIAVDSQGRVFVDDPGAGRVDVFTQAGGPTIAPGS